MWKALFKMCPNIVLCTKKFDNCLPNSFNLLFLFQSITAKTSYLTTF